MFYPFSVKINGCSGNFNNINDPYARICVPDTVKHLNFKAFNLMSRTNETRSIKWHKSCTCICRLNGVICNNKQGWSKDKCRCECKELMKEYAIKDLFGIEVTVNANAINLVILVNI